MIIFCLYKIILLLIFQLMICFVFTLKQKMRAKVLNEHITETPSRHPVDQVEL